MTSLAEMTPADLDARAARDARHLERLRACAERWRAELDRHASLWTRDAHAPLGTADRRIVRLLFDRALDLEVAYETVVSFHMGFWRIDPLEDSVRHARHFALATAAYLRRLSIGLELVDRVGGLPPLERALDEACPELGLAEGAYGRLRSDLIDVEHVARVVAASEYHDLMRSTAYDDVVRACTYATWLLDEIDRAHEEVASRLTARGPRLFVENALDTMRRLAHRAIFPVQVEIATWLGDTRVVDDERALIASAQITEASAMCRPGDIVIERRNWYLSNIGLPGFWPHAAMWIGTPDELARFLDDDETVRAAYGGPFTRRLHERFPAACAAHAAPDASRHPRRILEAVSEGVVFSSAEHSLAADYAAAMRPRRSRLEIARAIERAFELVGRPYDFDFDFHTDTALVCSELVYNAWEGALRFDLVDILGRPTLPPNEMVAQFDRDHGTAAQQLDLVWFLDGSERTKSALFEDLEAFRASHRRMKWDIAQR